MSSNVVVNAFNKGFYFFVWFIPRHLLILISKGWPELRESHLVNQSQRSSSNLRDGGWQRRTSRNLYSWRYWNTILNCSKTTFLERKGQAYFIQGLLKCSYLDFSVKFMFYPFWVLVVRLILCICFLLSDVDKFRKQFVHLEENGGKSGPVNPLERKHVSLPRYLPMSTVFII